MTEPLRPRIPEIVRRPDLIGMTRKGLFAMLGAAGWFIWLHMLSPLAAALAWWFGYRRFEVYVLADAVRTGQTLRIYAMVVGAAGSVFILWSLYNRIRFRGRDRRGAPPPVLPGEIGRAFAIPEEMVLAAQRGKVMVFDFNEDGQILQVRATGPATEDAEAAEEGAVV